MPTIYNATAIQAKITDLLDEGAALNSLAASEDRDLTDAESARFDEIMAHLGDQDSRLGLYGQLETARRFEALRADAGAPRNTVPKPFQAKQPDGKLILPAAAKRHRTKAFTGADAGQTAYDSGMWLMAMLSQGRDTRAVEHAAAHGMPLIRAAATEGTTTAGGYTVPDPLSSTIIDVVERYGVLRKHCRVVPMTSDTLAIPKRNTGLTVDYPGEAAAIDLSDKAWVQVNLTAVKRATLSKVSSELNEDSVVGIMDDLVMEVGRAYGLQEDNEIINGDGTATYGSETGLVSGIHGNAVTSLSLSPGTAFNETTLAKVTTLISTLPEKYQPTAMFLMLRSTWHAVIVPLLTAANIGSTADIVSGVRNQLYGYPVEFSDNMPASAASKFVMFFGSFRDAILIGDRNQMAWSTSADYAFNEDVITLRSTRRYDINFHSLGSAVGDRAMVGLKTDAS